MDKIVLTLTLNDLLIQIVEESAELAQAAAKYYRVTHGANPSPVSVQDARDALAEEIAHVKWPPRLCGGRRASRATRSPRWRTQKIERWRRIFDAPRATDRD